MPLCYSSACVSHVDESLPHWVAECCPALCLFACAVAPPSIRWQQISRFFAPPCCPLAPACRRRGLQNRTGMCISLISCWMHTFVPLMCLRVTFCRNLVTLGCRTSPSPVHLHVPHFAAMTVWYQLDGDLMPFCTSVKALWPAESHRYTHISLISCCMHAFVPLLCLRVTCCRNIVTLYSRTSPSPYIFT